jgi:hypothetical protein
MMLHQPNDTTLTVLDVACTHLITYNIREDTRAERMLCQNLFSVNTEWLWAFVTRNVCLTPDADVLYFGWGLISNTGRQISPACGSYLLRKLNSIARG